MKGHYGPETDAAVVKEMRKNKFRKRMGEYEDEFKKMEIGEVL